MSPRGRLGAFLMRGSETEPRASGRLDTPTSTFSGDLEGPLPGGLPPNQRLAVQVLAAPPQVDARIAATPLRIDGSVSISSDANQSMYVVRSSLAKDVIRTHAPGSCSFVHHVCRAGDCRLHGQCPLVRQPLRSSAVPFLACGTAWFPGGRNADRSDPCCFD